MAKKPVGRRSRRSKPPVANGTIYAEALGIPGVIALTCHAHRVAQGLTTVLADYIEALYDPPEALLPPEIGPGARLLGTVRHELRLGRRGGRARVLHLHGPLFELPRGDGSYDYMAPLPRCFHSKSGLDEALVAELIADLPDFGIDAIMRRSLVSREKIIEAAEAHEAAQWRAMAQDGFAPRCLAIDTVFLSKKIGDKRKAVHVTAADPLTGIYCTLALIEYVGDERGPVIKRLAEAIGNLPHLEALLATATDDGVEREIVAAALALARAAHPTLVPLPVIDPFHVIGRFVKVLSQRRIVWSKKLKKRKSKKAQELARLMAQLARVIEKMRWSRIELCADTKKKMELIFEACPDLKEAYFIVDGLRRVFDCRSRETAERAYAAWRRELAKAKARAFFEEKAAYLDEQWADVRVVFEVFERSDALHDHLLSFGTNPVESLNERAKEVWDGARCSSLRLIELRLIAGQGYIAKALALSAPTLVRRQRKNPEKHPRRLRAERRRNKRLGQVAAPA